MEGLHIRTELESDFDEIHEVIKAAFANQPYSQQTEHHLVQKLRQSDAYVPDLGLVAVKNSQIVGHILLTKIQLRDGNKDASETGLTLAPVSVRPDAQLKGIGGLLIQEAHNRARQLGYRFVLLIGHAEYYPKFGYRQASTFNIDVPFDSPPQNVMVKELYENALQNICGSVIYPKAFFE